jgi:lysophospholipase L1-like esterase
VPFRSFVALGDSFTEGVGDPYPDGTYQGWADRFARHLAATLAGLTCANLAIRGKLVGQVIDEQIPPAIRLAPDLVSIAAGGNDCLSVDLWSMNVLADLREWCPDRLHLAPDGHRRVALRAAEVARVRVPADWREPAAAALAQRHLDGYVLTRVVLGDLARAVLGAELVHYLAHHVLVGDGLGRAAVLGPVCS